MLGCKDYTREELDHGKAVIHEQIARNKNLADAVARLATDKTLCSALEDFEGVFNNNLALVLDHLYVHKLRKVMGKDRNPLNEVELIRDSLTNNYGIIRGNNEIRYVPSQSVAKIKIGEKIHLTKGEFKRLAAVSSSSWSADSFSLGLTHIVKNQVEIHSPGRQIIHKGGSKC